MGGTSSSQDTIYNGLGRLVDVAQTGDLRKQILQVTTDTTVLVGADQSKVLVIIEFGERRVCSYGLEDVTSYSIVAHGGICVDEQDAICCS